ncbi:uncharacterized protein LOC130644685 isoform X2 [Hydractinia symbiolongicarpus]|uniref:uncharacterized protein LOC130644685 isoform X2 n=1 Tax=Hydractinia symbiolongicarpus TaxID=13093 RepID=UPI00254D1B41|nr:uncharacterized protein LOC130644685 isoform X2 [Hydractinia symbiolongicarpus]
MEQPKSLKHYCYLVLAENSMVAETSKEISTCKPLLHEYSRYLSPYGVSLLENITGVAVLDHIWLSQWSFVQSYSFKARARQKVQISSNREPNITHKEFFYDALMSDVIEELHKLVPVECISELLLILRKNKLTSVKLSCNENLLLLDTAKLFTVAKSIFNPINKSVIDFSVGTNEIRTELDSDINSGIDLYECAFEPIKSITKTLPCIEMVETNVDRLELFCSRHGSSVLPLFCNAFMQWKTLNTLVIRDIQLVSNLDTSLVTLLGYGNLQNLAIEDTDCRGFEHALKYSAAPVCTTHSKQHKIRKLSLYESVYNPDLLRNLVIYSTCLKRQFESERCSQQCIFQGLKSLTVTMVDEGYEISDYLKENKLLEELFIDKAYHFSNDKELLEAVADHPRLTTFSLSSEYKRCGEELDDSLTRLLQKSNMQQLKFDQCFSFKRLPVDIDAKYTSYLHTLIWTKNGLDNNGLTEFSTLIYNHLNFPHLKYLDLSDNKFTDRAIPNFARCLSISKRFLTKLSLYSSYLSYQAILDSGFYQVFQQHVCIMVGCYSNNRSTTSDYISEM